MEVFRLSRKKYAGRLSGKGASIKGGRWNSEGVELIYTALNRSLAMAEVAVHFTLATLPADYVMITVFIPDDLSVKKLHPSELPPDWNVFPHVGATQLIGDRFVRENKYGLLQVPSVVTQGDYNILINPHHPDFKKIKKIETVAFPFDERIFE